jgi:chorismate mutase/prephenate dehydratase
MNEPTMQDLRERIEGADREILRLLNERAEVSAAIGRFKDAAGLPVYDPAREALLLSQLESLNAGPLPREALREIYREILSVSRALQAPIRVLFLGPEASYSHQAALAHFGRQIAAEPRATIRDVFDGLERGQGSWGIAPVENSTEGSVKATLDRLIATPLAIRAEIFLRIRHCLMTAGGSLEGIRRIYSHPQALAQCQNWLRANLPGRQLIEVESTAGAAARLGQDAEGAAVASRLAAEAFGLNLLAEGIEDNPANTTRFFVLGPKPGGNGPQATGRDKTSILFGTSHAPGALLRALEPFAAAGINLMRIESYPLRERIWEYLFFADFAGHSEEEKTRACLDELARRTAFLKVLGSYPRGEEPA